MDNLSKAIENAKEILYQRTILAGFRPDNIINFTESNGKTYVLSNPVMDKIIAIDGQEVPRYNFMLEYQDDAPMVRNYHVTDKGEMVFYHDFTVVTPVPKLMPVRLPQLLIIVDEEGNVVFDGENHSHFNIEQII